MYFGRPERQSGKKVKRETKKEAKNRGREIEAKPVGWCAYTQNTISDRI